MMKPRTLLMCLLFCARIANAQDLPATAVQQLESTTENTGEETEDDGWLQQLEKFAKHPININTAEADELKLLHFISDLQINQLLRYRNWLGSLVSLYELQAVPAWDLATIKKILPYITVGATSGNPKSFFHRFSGGEHQLMLRVSQVLEKSAGYTDTNSATHYAGSPQHLLFRYRYSYKNLLQVGILGDKDAGEAFFREGQKQGFDFYSFHLFVRKTGIIKALAVGDYTVNLGQGLVQWQSLAMKKSMSIMNVKRQSPVLLPYNAAGEYYFNRGAGITLQKRKWEATLFYSNRKVSANRYTDTLSREEMISSLLTSGYHRTAAEREDRNRVTVRSFGGNISYHGGAVQAGINAVDYHFSLPLLQKDDPYKLYAISGRHWYNISADYGITWRNLHWFGEAAVDQQLNKAFLAGMLISADARVDLSIVFRHLPAAYQSVSGNAFTENTSPSNENGLYAGASFRPVNGWQVDAYADLFRFPWLRYLVDAPSEGHEYAIQLSVTPRKQVEFYTRWKAEKKPLNQPELSADGIPQITPTHFLVPVVRNNWRTELNYGATRALTLRQRVELVWYDPKGLNHETGFSLYMDLLYKPMRKPFKWAGRVQYFESDGYNSRIYGYENDVQYSYSIPALYGRGFRYYILYSLRIMKNITGWLRFSQTIYSEKTTISSGSDLITNNRKSELKLQLRWEWGQDD